MTAMDEKNDCKTPEEVYEKWKSDLGKKGKTPDDMVAFARSLGFEEYADKLQAFISKMEAFV